MSDDGYLLDNRTTEAGTRLNALSAIFDQWTFDHIDRTGIGPGWRCWEVGAGGPSVTRFLASRVGESGRVLATDIDLSWAAAAAGPQVELRRHDLSLDPTPDESFNLVHARLVLVHLPDRERALASLVGALRPGGWLVIEDADPALQPLSCLDPMSPGEELANRLRTGFRALMAERGVEPRVRQNPAEAAQRGRPRGGEGGRVLPGSDARVRPARDGHDPPDPRPVGCSRDRVGRGDRRASRKCLIGSPRPCTAPDDLRVGSPSRLGHGPRKAQLLFREEYAIAPAGTAG